MKRLLQRRVLPLLCCLSLTVGLFSYQPPKARALLTEASLATSVIWTFMQSAGLSFSGNNAGSQAWIDSCQSWYNKFMEAKADVSVDFLGWLGYDSWSAFLADIRYQKNPTNLGYQMFIPKAISSKLAEFTQWFIGELGLTSGGDSKPVLSGSGNFNFPGTRALFKYPMNSFFSSSDNTFTITCNDLPGNDIVWVRGSRVPCEGKILKITAVSTTTSPTNFDLCLTKDGNSNSKSYGPIYLSNGRAEVSFDFSGAVFTTEYPPSVYPYFNITMFLSKGMTGSVTFTFDVVDADAPTIDVTQPGTYSPAVDTDGDKATVVTVPGLDGDIASINDLLQQILDKLAANDLTVSGSVEGAEAPDVPATDVGWKGTIEKIYNAIIDLPGRIAEAIKDLFIPHEGYATEFVSSINGIFEDRMGLLTYPLSVLSDFVSTVATLDEQEPILRWNDVVWQNKTIIQKGEYNLKSALSGTAMQSAYSVYRTVVSAVLVIAFLHLLLKKLKEVQSN